MQKLMVSHLWNGLPKTHQNAISFIICASMRNIAMNPFILARLS